MQFDMFQLFCDIVELKSFSRAAEKNYISQSAVSQQVSQCESELKCSLLDRKKRPFELTEAGKVFYQSAKEILARFQKMQSDITMLSEEQSSELKVEAIFSIGMHLLQDYVKSFMVKHPSSNISLDFANSEMIYKDILSGQIDIGVVAIAHKDRNVEVYDFVEEELVLVCSPKHHFAGLEEIDIHKLEMEKFIAFGKDVPTREWIDNIFKRYNVVVHIEMEFNNTETSKRAVELNGGISVLPIATVQAEEKAGRLCVIRFSNEKFYRPSSVIVRKNRSLSAAGRDFLELLIKNRSKGNL